MLAKTTSKSSVRSAKARLYGAGAGPHVVLGVDVGRRAELGRELDQVAAADLETAALVDAGCRRVTGRARDRVGHAPVHAPP